MSAMNAASMNVYAVNKSINKGFKKTMPGGGCPDECNQQNNLTAGEFL